MSKAPTAESRIADNRKARFDYQIEETFEAGIVLTGWEVKSLRAGHAQLKDSHVIIKGGEAWLIASHISPLLSASTHVTPDAQRSRKLLLHERELNKLIGAVQRKGYTIIPLNMHWKRGNAKVDIALAKGKKLYDKRETEKHRDWDREKQKIGKLR
jgi:SsrA-binding protein